MIDSRSRVEDILNVILGNLDPSVLQPPQSRVEALLQRLNEMISDFDGKIPVHICTSSEYDHETLMPTIEDPEENAFYLVPANESGDDMYIEWIFTESNRWERFGSGGGTVQIKQSDWNQNDSLEVDYIKNKPDLTLKLDKNQGAANSGKFMGVNSSGNVVPLDVEGGNIAVTEELVSGEDYELGIEGGETGSVISVAGKTGTVTLDGNDVVFNDAASYNDGTIGGTVADLKSQITTSGILTPPFELGNISYNATGWGIYTNSNSRVRVPSGSEIELSGGDIIYCDSSIVAYYSCTADNSKWTVRGWFTGQIVAPFSGKYSFLLRKSTESTISDITDVTSKFAIFSGGMSSIFYDTSNFVNIIGLENAINRSYIKYSSGEEVFTGSNVFTRKFFNPAFKRLKAFCTSSDTIPAAIGFYSTTTAESASYISGVNFNNNSANGSWYMADVPENCKLVTVTSRSDGNPVVIFANADILSDKVVESYYNRPSFFIPAKPRIVKHGGDSAIAPENSLPLFNLAGRSGYWGIETDVRKTSDNVLVCMHDSTIDRTTTGTGAVASMTYGDLQNYTIDVGDYTEYTTEELRVPTFEEYLKVCRKYGCVAIIELYNISYGTLVIDTIKKMGMEDSCVIFSFASNIAGDVRTWSKKIPFIMLYTTGTALSTADVDSLPLNAGFAVGADANGNVATYSQNLLDYARTNNRYIGVWTVNAGNIEKWEDAGLDMITVYSKS